MQDSTKSLIPPPRAYSALHGFKCHLFVDATLKTFAQAAHNKSVRRVWDYLRVCVCVRVFVKGKIMHINKIENRQKILSGLEQAPLVLLPLLQLLLSLTYSILVALTQTLYYIEIDLTNILPGVYYIFVASKAFGLFNCELSEGRS